MKNYCVITVDGSRARFFTLRAAPKQSRTALRLAEHDGLVNAEKQIPDRQRFSSVTSGRNRGAGGRSYAFDDHRNRHKQNLDQKFARVIVRKMAAFAKGNDAERLVVAADSHMLGLIRQAGGLLSSRSVEIVEYPRDLTHMKAAAVQKTLARQNLLPPEP